MILVMIIVPWIIPVIKTMTEKKINYKFSHRFEKKLIGVFHDFGDYCAMYNVCDYNLDRMMYQP